MTLPLPTRTDTQHEYAVYRGVTIPMRDGVELYANIFFPTKDDVPQVGQQYPVILIRTAYAYGNGEFATQPIHLSYYANELGYVLVLQSCRGTFKSAGKLRPIQGDGEDGVDTVKWLLKQPWCNGKIATTGHSYLGGTEYLLHLQKDVPGLVTGVIRSPLMSGAKNGVLYDGDFVDASCMALWCVSQAMDLCANGHVPSEVADAIMADNEAMGDPLRNPAALNIAEWQTKYSPREMPIARHMDFYQEWLDARENPQALDFLDLHAYPHDMERPLLFMSGWCDLLLNVDLEGYEKAVADAPSEEIAGAHRLIVGPWGHMAPLGREFPGSDTDDRLSAMEWVDSKVNGTQSAFFDENPVVIYVMGENRWRSEQSWPLPDGQAATWYLGEDGSLSAEQPQGEQPADRYTSDPADRIFDAGGHGLFTQGFSDQREFEKRGDVLSYTTAPLAEDVEVTGAVRARIFMSTTSNDADLIVKLVDVEPDGPAWRVTSGGRRARYLKGGRSNPQPVLPGEIVEYDVELRATSYVFKKGHSIRIDICSSDPLNKDVGPNSFVDLNEATPEDFVVAEHSVFHDALHPSSIELTVIPADRERKWIDWPFGFEKTGVEMNKGFLLMPGFGEPPTAPAVHDPAELPTVDAGVSVTPANDIHAAVDTIRF